MFSVRKNHDVRESNLIRLHPKAGGVNINFGRQYFQGVSTDIFFSLDERDLRKTYHSTRKLNISISVNPMCLSVEQFLSYVTSGKLERTQKCTFHGDIETGLYASNRLMELLSFKQFDIEGKRYVYDSIGVACNQAYASVSHRKGNDFENSSSHFEIKFRRQSDTQGPKEYLCLNIHLMPEHSRSYGWSEALERLKQAICLFYTELGLGTHSNTSHTFRTNFRLALNVTLNNYEKEGFSCKHEQSLDVLETNAMAVRYTHDASKNTGLSLWDYAEKTKRTQKNKKHAALNAATATMDTSLEVAEEKPRPNAWAKKLTL